MSRARTLADYGNGIDTASITSGTFATARIADDAITLDKMASGVDGKIITYDASGNPSAVGPGTDGQVLTSTGAGSPPAFEVLPQETNLPAFRAYESSNQAVGSGAPTELVCGTQAFDSPGRYNTATGRFTPLLAGWYFIYASCRMQTGDTAGRFSIQIRVGGTQETSQEIEIYKGNAGYQGVNISSIIQLSAVEYVSPYGYHNKGSDADLYDINFSGFRIIGV